MKKRYLEIAIFLLVVFSFTMFFLTRFNESTLITRDGYFVTGKEIDSVLLNQNKVAKTSNVLLEELNSTDKFIINMNKTYVGEDRKKEVNTVYPLYINNGLGIVNLDSKSTLINNKFEYFDTYENFTLTGGKLYNFGDYEQADYEDYIFLHLSNGTYVNLTDISIEIASGKYEIPVNSIANFQEDFFNYYFFDKEGKLVYKIVDGISLDNIITINEKKYTYEDFLSFIGKYEREEEEPVEEEKPSEEVKEEEYIIEKDDKNNNASEVPAKYVAPKVSSTDFTANVYSAKARLSISDPSRVIVGGVNFQFFVNDKVFLRKTFISGGNIEVIGLVPNTKFKIVGNYKYYNEDSKKMEITFFEQEITTLGVDNLEPIELQFSNGDVYPNKIELKDLQITSSLASETIKGINKVIIVVGKEQFSIPTSLLNEMISGKSVTYTSPAKLTSNSNLDFTIKFLDAYNNEIKIAHNTGKIRTSKNTPTAAVKITSSAVNEVTFNVNLKNQDEVNVNNFRYVVTDASGNIFKEESLNSKLDNNNVSLKNLNPNTIYNIKVYGNYDIEDGQGTVMNQVMGEGKFTTAPLSSLGFFRVVASPIDLTDNSATISSKMDTLNVSSILLDLLNTLTVTITDESDNIVYTKTYSGSEIERIKAGEDFDININNLSSVTTYTVNYTSTVKQGTVQESVNVLCSLKNFKTYKRSAEIQIANEFVTSSMIDFDVRAVDLDGAVESGRVLLEIRDSRSNLVAKEYLDLNADYVQLSYTKLNPNETYTFNYFAEEYNIGYSNATYAGDYSLLTKTIVTEDGISGNIELIDLLRDITGTNLFNLEDYNRIRKEGNTGYKEYDIKNNTVMFGAKNGYVTYSYFLPEAYQKIVTISFKARYNRATPNKAPVYISLGYGNNTNYLVKDIEDDYKDYSFTFYSSSNYIGFNINETANMNKKTTVDFKDIQIIYSGEDEYLKADSSLSSHPSGYVFQNTKMIDGNSEMPDWNNKGATMIGNASNGHARITRLSDGRVFDFNYTGSAQTFNVPTSDIYKFECWGASGGDNSNPVGSRRNIASRAGRGAYTSGELTLDSSATFYVYVGGAGVYGGGTKAGGWNGGGTNGRSSTASGSGGGATDIRLVNGAWDNLESLQSRIMVAGAGGGSDNAGGTLNGGDDGRGGSGGTLFGENPYINGVVQTNMFSSQISGYAFGVGASPTTVTDTGGAGGGYYGGLPSNHGNGGGGGGSSYISGHHGCISYNNASVFTTYNSYTENNQYQGTFEINMNDIRNEISTKDYYVRIYRKGEYVTEHRYDMHESVVEGVQKTYGFDKNVTYEVALSVKMRDRYYDIDSVEFTTETEIRAIRTTAEFFAMHPDGKYIVLNDLDFTKNNTYYSSWFYGEIDFQGNKLIKNALSANARLFEHFRSSAVLKNVVYDVHLDNTSSREWFYGLITYNYGTLDNIYMTLYDSTDVPNYVFALFCYANYGRITNFVIHSEAPMSALAASGMAVWSNQGILRNGYVYGENIRAYHQNIDRRSRKDVGGLVGEATNNSRIENVFSLISVEKNNGFGTGEKETSVGNIVGYHAAGYFGNSYSVESSDSINTNLITQDPNIGKVGGIRKNNLYYVSDRTYGGTYSNKVSKLALYDTTFQNQVLNTYDGFDVDHYVSLGYYPQVILNDCMPKQDWIELPKITDGDLVDVTSVEEIENNGDNAVVKLHINNPSNETINKVTITDINTVEIVSQVNSFGKTELTVRLSNPRTYKSRYYVDTLYIKPAYGTEYLKTYEKNERAIDIDLYYPIANLNDWKIMVSNPSQNYCLTEDLDFKNASISNYVVNGTFNAKFDGRGHTIKNITINSSNAMFNTVTGTIKNLFVVNYKKTNNTSYGGFVYSATSNATFDNVHITNSQVFARDRIGGLVGSADSITIRNSSVTGFVPSVPAEQENSYIGGLVGYANLTFIENSYAQDVDINITNAISTLGVGGIAGRMNQGTLNNAYATGTIRVNTINVGGLVGWNNAYISNVWSYVDLITELDYVGGIAGKTDNSSINNSMVYGAVYSTYVSNEGNNIHRTSGNNIAVIQSNYAWDKQKYYGFVTGESSSEVLLTTEDLQEETTYQDLIGLGESFDYTQIENNIVPKLKSSDSVELLPNQKDVVLESELFDVKSIDVEPIATSATIHMVIDNPNQYQINSVGFDYLKVTRERYNNDPNDGTTIVDLTVIPDKYFDSYTFNNVTYIDGSGNEKNYEKIVRVELQFFKSLASYDDWTHVSKVHAENYRVTGDIDFSGKSNINVGVLFGRLEGLVTESGVNYKLMNYTRTGINATKTNLIKKITTTMKNVDFENIEMRALNKSYNYINIIYLNYADIENVAFRNITIEAASSGYVAPIGLHRGQNINDITMDTINITGKNYSGGLISNSYNTSSTDIDASNVTVYSTGQYVGGIIAYKEYRNGYNTYNYTGHNMTITGVTDVGGLFGYGGCYNAAIYDSTITGINGGNYLGGIGGRESYETDNTQLVSGCTIVGSGNYVGGLYGWARHYYNGRVVDTTVTQTNSAKTYVGGAFGYQDGYTHSNIGLNNVTVTNAGDYTGGIAGRLNGGGAVTYSFSSNVTVNGRNYVGGVAGSATTARLYYNVVNAKVTGSGDYVGGAFGYISSVHATDNSYSAIVYELLVANSVVTGNNYVGGFVGSTKDSQITPAKFYNIILVADVTANASSDVYAGAINGLDNRKYSAISMTKVRLYENNRLNGRTLKSLNLSMIPAENLATSTNLKTSSYYTGFGFATSRWDYTDIATYFPRVKRASSGAVESIQKQLTIPTSTISFNARMSRTAPIDHELPTLNVYSSGINTINLDFDKHDDFSFFTVYDSGVKIFEQDIQTRTYTVNYDYQANLKIVVSDGRNNKIYQYSGAELRNLASTYGKKYAYIYQGKLKGNVDDARVKGKYIHVYKNLALTDELEVVDINTGTITENSLIFTISLADIATPLFTFDYKDTKIDTYYTYSIIHKDDSDVLYDNQLFVKNGSIEIVDSLLDSYHNMLIIDNYSKNNYVTVLGKDGALYDLKSPISMPTNFSNKGIMSITNNIESDTSTVILIYKTGKVVIFDYRTGAELSSEKATEDVSIFEYFKENFNQSNKLFGSGLTSNYQEALNLKEMLTDTPIEYRDGNYSISEDDSEDTTTPSVNKDKNYITYYNTIRNDYDVVDVSSLVNSEDYTINDSSDVITENNKIYTSNSLVEYYMKESIFTEVFKNINGLYIFGLLLVGIFIALGLWIKNARSLRSVEEE